jgi:hypothetical protein
VLAQAYPKARGLRVERLAPVRRSARLVVGAALAQRVAAIDDARRAGPLPGSCCGPT